MNPISAVTANTQTAALNASDAVSSAQGSGTKDDPEKVAEVSRQFEAILMRQFLSESVPMLRGGKSGQVYGYLLTDSLADAMTKAGGLGLSNILQAQLHT
jgi:peptidoglycan hydrolase FlgJ